MANIQIDLAHTDELNAAWSEYVQITKGDTLIEGPPVFGGGPMATGRTYITTPGFAAFLRERGLPFTQTGA